MEQKEGLPNEALKLKHENKQVEQQVNALNNLLTGFKTDGVRYLKRAFPDKAK